jgi:Tfp pilus assembly protein PilF
MGKHIDAAQDYERAYEIDPEDSALLNNFSWLLSTSPDDEVRDGERAIELAMKAAELTDFQKAHILSTLAAGYAETGDFDKAREWSTKAVELAAEGEQKENLSKELESYQEDKPWRERQEEKDRDETQQKSDLDL